MYREAFPVNHAVQTIKRLLFGYPQEELSLITSSEKARESLKKQLNSRLNPIFPSSVYHIHSFLAYIASVLLVSGRVCYAMVWSDDGKQLVRFKRLPVETVRVKRKKGEFLRFHQQYSLFTTREMVQEATPNIHWSGSEQIKGTTFHFDPDEVFYLEWPFDRKGRQGYSPSRDVLRFAQRWTSFHQRIGLQAEARAQPELRDWRHVLARQYDFARELERQQRAEVQIRKVFRVVQDGPVTPYFDIWQHKEMLQFVGGIRKFLLDEFNAQVVGPILQKNGIEASARYVCDNKLSNQEIQQLFDWYAAGDISYKEALDQMLKDKPAQSDG